jgi:hypothetical protein
MLPGGAWWARRGVSWSLRGARSASWLSFGGADAQIEGVQPAAAALSVTRPTEFSA